MTCIAGFVEGSTVWIGGDSAGCSGWDLTVRADQKVFRNGPMLFGFTSSFRMGQLLRYALTIPERTPDTEIDRWMTTTFIDAVRECLKSRGWSEKEKEQEKGGTFLIGYEGRLFRIDEDYQVGIPQDGFEACGCGGQVARGALFATDHLRGEERMLKALTAAERCSAGVRGPFHVESL